MKHLYKKLSSLIILLTCCTAYTDSAHPITPKFTIRSQGANALRRMVQSVGIMNIYDICTLNGTVAITPEYTSSIRTSDIITCLFGGPLCGACDQIKIQGSRVADRDETAWLADYFYLPTDFSSTISVRPNIQNFLIDFFGYIGLDNWVTGLYAWVQAPLTWTKWDLNFCERVQAPGELAYLAGYFSPEIIERNSLLENFSSYIRGNAPQDVTQEDITITFNGLTCGKICGSHSKTTLSELRVALGWNFLLCQDYHLGFNLQVSAPTGNKVDAQFLFAPQNGNDHHWEFGFGIDGHTLLWQSDCEDAHFGFYYDINLTHMFKNKQTRCFDLCGKQLSRYMLAERMDAPNNDQELQSATDNTIFPTTKFNNVFAPVANITTRAVNVSIGAQADIVAMFNYTNDTWSWDIGYNLWVRSGEKLTRNNDCGQFEQDTWALKGDAQVFGFDTAVGSQARALSATMSNATINNGENFGPAGVTPGSVTESVDIKNLGVDHPTPAAFNGNNLSTQPAPAPFNAINTSIPPVFIAESDINFTRIKSLSNKLFTHFGYTWNGHCNNPYVGIGFEVEFTQPNQILCDDECNPCGASCNDNCSALNGDSVRCGLSQWGVWLKGGLAFN